MPRLTFIEPDGTEHHVEAFDDETVMQAAMDHGVPGILADCGGACSCATCHVYVDEKWLDRLPDVDDMEAAMLEYAVHPAPNSRLSCQLTVNDDLDGMVLRLPASQL